MRKQSDPFYRSALWRRVRALALTRDGGKCCDCMDRFHAGYGIRPRDADMVHHIIPREQRPDLALNLDNLRSLCNQCHNRAHPEKGAGEQKRETARKMRVVKV